MPASTCHIHPIVRISASILFLSDFFSIKQDGNLHQSADGMSTHNWTCAVSATPKKVKMKIHWMKRTGRMTRNLPVR